MSVVSSVLLQLSCVEDAHDGVNPEWLSQLNAWLKSRHKLDLVRLDEIMARGRHPQTCVVGGGYNYFPEDEFADFVMAMKWESPENVVLIINPEDGPTRIWRAQG